MMTRRPCSLMVERLTISGHPRLGPTIVAPASARTLARTMLASTVRDDFGLFTLPPAHAEFQELDRASFRTGTGEATKWCHTSPPEARTFPRGLKYGVWLGVSAHRGGATDGRRRVDPTDRQKN